MVSLIGDVATGTVLLTLVVSAAGHVRKPGHLAAAIRTHRVVGAPSLFAAAVIVAEAVVGGVGMVGVLWGHQTLVVGSLTAGAVLFTCYTGYTWHVWASGRDGTCGCSGADVPVTGWVVGRASALAALAVAALVASRATVDGVSVHRPGAVVALLAAVSFTALLRQLPAAMYVQTPQRRTIAVLSIGAASGVRPSERVPAIVGEGDGR